MVPYDAAMEGLFWGEEAAMALRLWTRGFRFHAPCDPIVFHLWSR